MFHLRKNHSPRHSSQKGYDNANPATVGGQVQHTSADGRSLIEHYVGCCLTATLDESGRLTIGYGDLEGVKPGMQILLPQADRRLQTRLARDVEPAVRAALTGMARQHEFDALVSLAHGIGVAAFRHSNVMRHFNNNDVNAAALAFLEHTDEGGPGLALRRRVAEQALFRGLTFVDAIRKGDTADAA